MRINSVSADPERTWKGAVRAQLTAPPPSSLLVVFLPPPPLASTVPASPTTGTGMSDPNAVW